MKYGIELIFDSKSQEKINQIRALIFQNGVNDDATLPSHITIANIETENIDQLCKITEEFAKEQHSFEITLGSVGSFMNTQNVIFYSPIMNENLQSAHKLFLSKLGELRSFNNKYYEENTWTPHSTIVNRISDEEFLKTMSVLKENNILPLTVKIEKVDILLHVPQPYQRIKIFDLKN